MKKFIPLIIAMSFIALLIGYSATPSIASVDFYLMGVSTTGVGELVPFQLELKPGTGKVLVDASDASYRRDTADSLAGAKDASEKVIGLPLKNMDLFMNLDIGSGDLDVGGNSGGAAFAIAIISAYYNVQPNQAGVISAALDGEKLVSVGGMTEKIVAATSAGKTFFVVSKEQEIRGENVLKEKIQIIRASSLKEAAKLFLG